MECMHGRVEPGREPKPDPRVGSPGVTKPQEVPKRQQREPAPV